MASIIKVKRSAVSGNAPNTTTLDTAELAINTADGILYSANGTDVFEVGANLSTIRVGDSNIFEANSTGGLQVRGNTQLQGEVSIVFNNFDYGNTAHIKSDTDNLIITNENNAGHTVFVGAGIDVQGNVFANGDSSQLHVGNSTVNVVASGGDLDTSGNVSVGGTLSVDSLGNANEILIVDTDGSSVTSTSTLTIDDSSNYVGINQTSPDVTLHMTGEGAQSTQIRMEQYNSTADAPDLRTRKARGTISSPSDIQAGDYLFRMNVEGRKGDTNVGYHSLQFDVDDTDADAGVVQLETRDTDGTSATRLGVDSSGDFYTTGTANVNALVVNAQAFPSEDGGTGQILKTYGNGTLYWTNEAGAAGFSAFTLYEFTATNGQTNFAGNDDNSQSLGYRTADSIQVYLNGILLEETQDYTATNGANVILTSAASTDDFLQIFSYGIASSNNITIAPNNNIGIANTEPAHLLSVNGQGFFAANVKFGDTILDNSDRQLKIYYANGDVAWGE